MIQSGIDSGVFAPASAPPAADAATARIQVVVLSPLRFFADALASELSRQAHLEARGWSAVDPRVEADVMLVDVHSGGLDLLRCAHERFPSLPILALGVDERPAQVMACVEAGAAGYVRKDAILGELVAAIERARRGEALCPPAVAGELFRRVAGMAHDLGLDPLPTALLTPREREIAGMVSRGFTNKAIARELGLRVPTVKTHVHQVLRKMGVSSRVTLLAAARRDPGLLSGPTPPSISAASSTSTSAAV